MTDRDQYERDLRRRQAEHLRSIREHQHPWQPCLHDQCPDCLGTGVRRDGGACVHNIACPCPECSVTCCGNHANETVSDIPLILTRAEWAEVTL